MKYIEISDLEDLSRFLTDQEIGNAVVNGKIECYSTNSPSHRVVTSTIPTHESSRHHDVTAGSHNLISDLPTSTLDILAPRRARAFSCDVTFGQKNSRKRSSSLGDLNEPSTRQLLFDLISTLNESNPDYDFHCSNVENFIEKDVFVAMRTINNSLAELTQKDSHLLEKIWRNIDVAINLRRCEVISYTPESEEDAFGDNFLWSLNYFFYNKENARICYLCISAASKYSRVITSSPLLESFSEHQGGESDDEDDEDEDETKLRLSCCDEDDDDVGAPADWDGII